MFRPDSNRDRTDYSGILMPPDGYRLDRAVGTTYSLDLEALTAVAICLGLSEETDSKLMQNPIGMLNALQKVSDKIVLFCEAGQIKVPTKPTALSILLEKMVVEVALPKDRQLGRYPSFHPKTWVLAYVNAEGDKKYRFVVMSRNLTYDRSWDISFAMDSSKNVRQKKKTQPICDFLDYLVTNVHNTSNNAGKKRNLIRGLCADIKDVSFSLDSKIFGENFEVLPLGIGKNAYRMQEDILFCKERGNANVLLGRLLCRISGECQVGIVAMQGGLADNAIPREAEATLVVAEEDKDKLDSIVKKVEQELQGELASKDAGVFIQAAYENVGSYEAVTAEDTKKAAAFLMSAELPGLVETSLNLGVMSCKAGTLSAEFSVRSSVESAKYALIDRLQGLTLLAGGTNRITGDYPGWKYRKDSPLRDKMVRLYEKMYGVAPKVEAIHAGLECGILGSKIADLDCVSMGPDMTAIHTTEETLNIPSTRRVWEYLVALLEEKEA